MDFSKANIFGHSFETFFSSWINSDIHSECLKPLNKIKKKSTQNFFGNMTFHQLIFKKFPCPHLLSHLPYPFIFIFQNIWSIFFIWIYSYIHLLIYYIDKYIWTFIHDNVINWIYSNIHSWVIGSNEYIRIFIRQRKITFTTHCAGSRPSLCIVELQHYAKKAGLTRQTFLSWGNRLFAWCGKTP